MGASQVVLMVKKKKKPKKNTHLPLQETQVQSLGWEDPLEEGMATHSSILVWRICIDRGDWWATVPGVAKTRTRLNNKAYKILSNPGTQVNIHCPTACCHSK